MRLRTLTLLLVAILCSTLWARAERPLLDYHRLDAYFQLFANDSNVPWKTTDVRLDTYTNAPVEFSAYAVDPADVIIAGENTRPRAVDTSRMRPIVQWRYVPPGGYRYQSNEVPVPLGTREGFFVIEARRGKVGEQVWIDRTRVGLLTKETPAGIVLYGTDLGTGRPLAHMRVGFIVRSRFVYRYTNADGIIRWQGGTRPIFAMASWGKSIAFVSFLPQAPLPKTIVGVKTESAVIHAGGILRVVGFARSRNGSSLQSSHGSALILLRSPRNQVARIRVPLDRAGAFVGALNVPPHSPAGTYTLMATVDGATAGTLVHVDADPNGLRLNVAPQCRPCNPAKDVPVVVRALRNGSPAAGVSVAMDVVRLPHVFIGRMPSASWGLSQWYRATARANSRGEAKFFIPHPNDGLASTYGVRVRSGGATADTRIVVPTARITLNLSIARTRIGSGMPAAFEVRARSVATGDPVGGLPVTVQLIHGASVDQQTLHLNARGTASGAFSEPEPGSDLIVAKSDYDGEQAADAAQIAVEPQTMQSSASRSGKIKIALDEARYRVGQLVHVQAIEAGAQGDAVISLESATSVQLRVVPVRDGRAATSFRAADALGMLTVGAAFVRDGALDWSSTPLEIDGNGRPLAVPVAVNRRSYAPGASARFALAGIARGQGTLVARVSRGAATGAALFDTVPQLLAVGMTTTQDTAGAGMTWHPWVDSTGAHPLVQAFARRTAPPAVLSMTQAETQGIVWRVERDAGNSIALDVPHTPGRYIVSLLKIDDDGRIAAGSAAFEVR